MTDDQAARCAHILKVAAWANSYGEVTLRDCVLLQYLAARPGCSRRDINIVFQAVAWREGTGKDAEAPTVSPLAVTAATELAESAVLRAEEAHVSSSDDDAAFCGPGEGSVVAGVSTPFARELTNLVDRLLAKAGGSGGGGGEENSVSGESVSEAQRRTDAYSAAVRERVLRRLEAGSKACAAERSWMMKPRSFLSRLASRRNPPAGGAEDDQGVMVGDKGGLNAPPLVLVTLIAPPTPDADGPHAKGRNARLRVGDVGAAMAPRRDKDDDGSGEAVIRGSGKHCVARWWGARTEASVHWSDVEVVQPFQMWMTLPLVRLARECLENAAAALASEREKCAAAEEELWSGYAKFVRKCGGGDGAYLWINGDQEAALFGEFVQHVMAPAYAALVAPAARVVAAQARMILADIAAVNRNVEPLTRWCALYPGRGGAPPGLYRERVRAMMRAAKLRVEDLREDVRQLETFCDTAGVPVAQREKVAEALGAACFLDEKISMHTSLWV